MRYYNCKSKVEHLNTCAGPSVDTSTEDEDEDEDEDKERKQKRERKQKQKQKQEQEQEQEPQVFLSYNWNIQDRVLELKRHLESLNIKCWMDTGNMVGGDDLKREIDKGMRGAKVNMRDMIQGSPEKTWVIFIHRDKEGMRIKNHFFPFDLIQT